MENKEIQELKRLCLFVRSSIEICQTSNPQVISNSNLRGSKVFGHVNHDS